jgi:hypothetical protein
MIFSDWIIYFYPQITDPWHLHTGIFNLPWLYVLLYPLSFLGPKLSAILIQIISLLSIWYMSSQLQLSPVRRILIFLSPPVLWGVFMGQFDSIFLLAYFLPVWVAPLAVLFKPQINIGSIRSLKPLWPFFGAGVLILSAYMIWKWPLSIQFPDVGGPNDSSSRGQLWNWSFWPYGLILGPLLLLSKDIRIRMGVSPFLFPYAGIHSLIGPLLGLATCKIWIFLSAWGFMWIRWWIMVNTGPG